MADNLNIVDLSRMEELPACAVLVSNEEDLDLFFESAKANFGSTFTWSKSTIKRYWSTYKDRAAFTRMDLDDGECRVVPMMCCDFEWFEDHGYKIVNFEELANQPDIEDCGESLSVLFGGDNCG